MSVWWCLTPLSTITGLNNFWAYIIIFKEYLKLVWVSLRLINREAVYEKRKLTQTRLWGY